LALRANKYLFFFAVFAFFADFAVQSFFQTPRSLNLFVARFMILTARSLRSLKIAKAAKNNAKKVFFGPPGQ
jgi:hypothetical protein